VQESVRGEGSGSTGRERGRRAGGLAGCLLLLLAFPLPGCSSTGEDRRMLVARQVFDRYCSDCHGTDASGPTPVAGLGFQPADLRHLGDLYGTPLDREQLAAYIDGRHAKASGEARLMPVWGDRLYANLPETVEMDEIRAGTIELLIDYLASIQAAEPAAP
jgi:hypothetical protein